MLHAAEESFLSNVNEITQDITVKQWANSSPKCHWFPGDSRVKTLSWCVAIQC